MDTNTRNESDIGKHYERQILAFISLKCVLDETIDDFWIKFNPAGIEKFDDIILYVKYNTGQKEIFLMQLKHKINTNDKCITAKMFQLNKKDFNLNTFQKAYKEITETNTFFEKNLISDETRKFFVLYNNSKIKIENTENSVTETSENTNIDLQFEKLIETDFRAFLSDKSFVESTGYKLNSINQLYDQDFLDNFYFYPEQLHLHEVKLKLEHLSGLKHVADNLIHYVDEFTKPTNKIKKVEKLDVKIQILSSIFGNFQPSAEDVSKSPILDIVKKFNVTVISDDYSENVIWNEILLKMRDYCNDYSLELSSWQDLLPQDSQEQFGFQARTKDVYFRMVAEAKVPLYIKTNNISFPMLLQSLFPKLGVCMVVFNSKKENLHFPNLKVFETLRDFNENLFQMYKKSICISFKGRSKVPLLPMIENDNSVREKITADFFIKLQSHSLRIGVKDESDSIYISRTLKISTIKEDILGVSENVLFIICNFPPGRRFKRMENILVKLEGNDEAFQRYFNSRNYAYFEHNEYLGLTHQYCNLITTTKSYSTELFDKVINSTTLKTFYFLQYVDQNEEGCRFILIKTNGKRNIMEPYLSETTRTDSQLINFFEGTPVNFICNKGGMGKSMLLKYLLKSFPPDEWVIHAELGKYRSVIEKIDNFDDFMSFFYDNGLSGVDSEFGDISRQLYQYSKQNGKLTFLLDDCDEVVNIKLLNFLKEASNRGMKLWIAARPGLREEFENIFETFSIELSEFSGRDQTRFFKKFFHKKGRSKPEINRKLRSIQKVRRLFKNSFIGNCQQTKMIAVVFNTDEETSLKQNRVDELYEKFINLKIKEHYDKNRDFIVRTVSKLAMAHFFSETVLKKIFDWSEFQCDIEVFRNLNSKPALVASFDENNIPEFTHKTYAEFLAGRWLAQHVRRQIKNETPFNLTEIVKLLYFQEFTNVRLFFDSILTNKNPITHKHKELHETDILGRNFLHIFLSYGDRYDMHTEYDVEYAVRVVEEHPQIDIDDKKILVKVPEHPVMIRHKGNNKAEVRFPPNIEDLALKKDAFLNNDPIQCALVTGCLKKLNNFVKEFDDISIDFSTMKFNKYLLLVYCVKNQLNHILTKLDISRADEDLLKVRDMSSHMSLLHMAVESVNLEAVELLLKAFPVRRWGVDSENNTPLHYAFRREYNKALTIFQKFTSASDVFNFKNSRGYSHLHCAVRQKNVVWTKLILSWPGVEVDAECSQGNTPFILGIINNKLQIAKLLKENEADINHKNQKGWTALHFTASKGLLKCTQELTKWRAELDTKNYFGETPLIRATIKGNEAIVKCLLEHNADINETDSNEWSALHHAVKRKKISILRLLLKKKANVDAVNKIGNTPLMIACINDVPEAVGILLDYHAKVNYQSEKGNALEISIRKNHTDCIAIIESKIRERHAAHAKKKRKIVLD